MSKITKAIADKILVGGWNSALNELHNWIKDMREEEDLTKSQKRLLLELEQHVNMMHNVWIGKNANN